MRSAPVAWLALGLAQVLAGCGATLPTAITAGAVTSPRAPVTILVSIDGFRPDYRDRGVTPVLDAWARAGAYATMRPSFPTKTFPNHYAIVTGKRPDRNGIVGNRMHDPRRPADTFTIASDDPFWWDEAEPIWTSAERAGVRTATLFWPGSTVAVAGVRPHDWAQYNQNIPEGSRVDAAVDWLRRPAATRPRLVTLYFDTVDTAGHEYGPEAPETTAAIAAVDRQLGRLRDELAAMHQPANIVIVSDHGMTAIAPERVVRLDQMVPATDYRLVEDGAYATFDVVAGRASALARALTQLPAHVTCWRKAAIPARLHYGTNPRVPGWLCLADPGWLILGHAPDKPVHGGTHGYDNAAPTMASLFVASGPDIAPAGAIADVDNVDVAPLLRALIGLPADVTGDGDPTRLARLAKQPS